MGVEAREKERRGREKKRSVNIREEGSFFWGHSQTREAESCVPLEVELTTPRRGEQEGKRESVTI
jgi:hypothetical protein